MNHPIARQPSQLNPPFAATKMDQNTETYDNMGTWYDLYGKLRVVEAIIDAATVQASVKTHSKNAIRPFLRQLQLVGGAINILKYMKVNGKDYPIILWNIKHVPNHQSENMSNLQGSPADFVY